METRITRHLYVWLDSTGIPSTLTATAFRGAWFRTSSDRLERAVETSSWSWLELTVWEREMRQQLGLAMQVIVEITSVLRELERLCGRAEYSLPCLFQIARRPMRRSNEAREEMYALDAEVRLQRQIEKLMDDLEECGTVKLNGFLKDLGEELRRKVREAEHALLEGKAQCGAVVDRVDSWLWAVVVAVTLLTVVIGLLALFRG